MNKKNMMKVGSVIVVMFLCVIVYAQKNNGNVWKQSELKLATRWSSQVSASNALPEYPRPQLVRDNWINLNGLWEYAITTKDASAPSKFDGQILVPYSIESALSGVKKAVQPNEVLWYRKVINSEQVVDKVVVSSLTHSSPERRKRKILHFGAVDWKTTVFVNRIEIGTHEGGYDGFSFDITEALKDGDNELLVKVYDPTDRGPNPHGKQVLNPRGIWYTPTTGIWQTVWMENVPANYISGLQMTPNVDEGYVTVVVKSNANEPVTLIAGMHKMIGETNKDIRLKIPNAKLWSPDEPYLYTLFVKTTSDEVKSYFGMRKIEIKKDKNGHERFFLNNKYVFNLGVLDQGFWPDGIYTAPTDEALAFDIKAIKSMGFNTIRKHIKREPDRWYYHCDRLGILVWQDMINPPSNPNKEAKEVFERECKEHITELYNHPSIITWTLFNEQWGSYDQERLSRYLKLLDPTRLLNGHSGEFIYSNGKLDVSSTNPWVASDITDVHSYPDPINSVKQNGKIKVLGEFGGMGVFVPEHQWNKEGAWGYIQVTPNAFKGKYRVMNQHLKLLEAEGLAASIYTQPFDVEGEQNGLMTYDRKIIKIPFKELRTIHSMLVPTVRNFSVVEADNADVTEPTAVYAALLNEYINGKTDKLTVKSLAEMALQMNDAAGVHRFTNEYVSKLTAPYDTDDLLFMERVTKNVTDAGFNKLMQRSDILSGTEKRALQLKLMNIVFTDIIFPYVPKKESKPNWEEVYEKVKTYGEVGEEIYLRAKTIHTMNQQDWKQFAPVAKEYLERFGTNLKGEEKKMFEEGIAKSK